jgi:hypothetical protein
MQHTNDELARILRRAVPTTFTREALALLAVGDSPDADLLARCGLRVAKVVAL